MIVKTEGKVQVGTIMEIRAQLDPIRRLIF